MKYKMKKVFMIPGDIYRALFDKNAKTSVLPLDQAYSLQFVNMLNDLQQSTPSEALAKGLKNNKVFNKTENDPYLFSAKDGNVIACRLSQLMDTNFLLGNTLFGNIPELENYPYFVIYSKNEKGKIQYIEVSTEDLDNLLKTIRANYKQDKKQYNGMIVNFDDTTSDMEILLKFKYAHQPAEGQKHFVFTVGDNKYTLFDKTTRKVTNTFTSETVPVLHNGYFILKDHKGSRFYRDSDGYLSDSYAEIIPFRNYGNNKKIAIVKMPTSQVLKKCKFAETEKEANKTETESTDNKKDYQSLSMIEKLILKNKLPNYLWVQVDELYQMLVLDAQSQLVASDSLIVEKTEKAKNKYDYYIKDAFTYAEGNEYFILTQKELETKPSYIITKNQFGSRSEGIGENRETDTDPALQYDKITILADKNQNYDNDLGLLKLEQDITDKDTGITTTKTIYIDYIGRVLTEKDKLSGVYLYKYKTNQPIKAGGESVTLEDIPAEFFINDTAAENDGKDLSKDACAPFVEELCSIFVDRQIKEYRRTLSYKNYSKKSVYAKVEDSIEEFTKIIHGKIEKASKNVRTAARRKTAFNKIIEEIRKKFTTLQENPYTNTKPKKVAEAKPPVVPAATDRQETPAVQAATGEQGTPTPVPAATGEEILVEENPNEAIPVVETPGEKASGEKASGENAKKKTQARTKTKGPLKIKIEPRGEDEDPKITITINDEQALLEKLNGLDKITIRSLKDAFNLNKTEADLLLQKLKNESYVKKTGDDKYGAVYGLNKENVKSSISVSKNK